MDASILCESNASIAEPLGSLSRIVPNEIAKIEDRRFLPCARARAKAATIRLLKLVQRGEEFVATSLTENFCRSKSCSIGSNNKQFRVFDFLRSHAVTRLATRDEIVRRVIPPVVIQMISHYAAVIRAASLQNHPCDLFVAPMTTMIARPKFFVENESRLGNQAVSRCEGMQRPIKHTPRRNVIGGFHGVCIFAASTAQAAYPAFRSAIFSTAVNACISHGGIINVTARVCQVETGV